MPKFNKLQKMIDKINLVSREILTGIPVIRAFSRERHEEKRFDKANVELTKTNLFVNRTMTLMMPLMTFIMNGVSLLIIWVGADLIDGGTMQVGDLMAFIQYSMMIIMSFLMLSMTSIMLPRAWVAAKRVAAVLNTENSIREVETGKPFDETKKGTVEFRDVSFRYPNAEENVIEHISFTAGRGETTAFIGATGRREVNADQPHPALLRRHRGPDSRRRRGRARGEARRPARPHRTGPAEGRAVLGHD